MGEDEGVLGDVLELVRTASGRDLSPYKSPTLARRVERRMGLRKIATLGVYLELLKHSEEELALLADDLLIGVTELFRDPEAFRVLTEEIIPPLVEATGARPLRIWLAGCATGEEAYSIALVVKACFMRADRAMHAQIFATDVDEEALSTARAGRYRKADVLANVPAELLEGNFSEAGDDLVVSRALRSSIVFAQHNALADPPFSDLDMVVCRNLLIYLHQDVQRSLLRLFGYALREQGILFLGSSESLVGLDDSYEVLSKSWRIFRRLGKHAGPPPGLPIHGGRPAGTGPVRFATSERGVDANIDRLYRDMLTRHGVVQLLLNRQQELVYSAGETQPYLSVNRGEPTHEIFRLIDPRLAPPLHALINKARQAGEPVELLLDGTEEDPPLRIEARPIEGDSGTFLLLGISPVPSAQARVPQQNDTGEGWIARQLMEEVNATREDLQKTIDEKVFANEELRIANEEVMAMNEELQSANEELEASREEMVRLNEELTAANEKLEIQLTNVGELNTDLKALTHASESALLLLDEDLRVLRFTPELGRYMRIRPGDEGRLLEDVVLLVRDPTLVEDCRRALGQERSADLQVTDAAGRHLLRRVFFQPAEHCTRVVVALVDVTEIERSRTLLLERSEHLEWQRSLVGKVAPVIARDEQDRVIFWNEAASAMLGWSEAKATGKVLHELLATEFPEQRAAIEREMSAAGRWRGSLQLRRAGGEVIDVTASWIRFDNSGRHSVAVVEMYQDRSELSVAQQSLEATESLFHTMLDWTPNAEYWRTASGRLLYITPAIERLSGHAPSALVDDARLFESLLFQESGASWVVPSTGQPSNVSTQLRLETRSGDRVWVQHDYLPVHDDAEQLLGWRGTIRDIRLQKAYEEKIGQFAYYDELTGLPNRRLLRDRFEQAVRRSTRTGEFAALLMLDLDEFKRINDTEGHAVGDEVLIAAGQRLNSQLRELDSVARLGGDEFVLLVNDLGRSAQQASRAAQGIAEKLRQTFDHPYDVSGAARGHSTTVSTGVAMFQGSRASFDTLLENADLALYKAKAEGRNRTRFFDRDVQQKLDHIVNKETLVLEALTAGRTDMWFQLVTDVAGQAQGIEALFRWFDEAGRAQVPGDLFTYMSDATLLDRLNERAIGRALEQLAAWQDHPTYGALPMSINVDANQFLREDFPDVFERTMNAARVDPKLVMLELDERSLLRSAQHVHRNMDRLVASGVRFVFDDFGSGYASLAHLRELPFSQIKIMRRLVSGIPGDSEAAAFVGGIVGVGKVLDLEVVAKGVETAAQRDYLFEHGCERFQGFLFSKPFSAVREHRVAPAEPD